MTALWMIVLCGVLSIVYAIWATVSVLKADAGNPRMQEIAAAVREGAQAYLKRQYMTIGLVGIVIFALLGYLLGMLVAFGFLIGAVLSGAAGFIGITEEQWRLHFPNGRWPSALRRASYRNVRQRFCRERRSERGRARDTIGLA